MARAISYNSFFLKQLEIMDDFQKLAIICKNLAMVSKIVTDNSIANGEKCRKIYRKRILQIFLGAFLTRKTVENTEKFTEIVENTERCTEKNLQQKNAENCTRKKGIEKYTENCTAKKIQKNVQKNILKKFTDKKFSRFFWSFFGPRKAEKIREKFPGGKKICKKILVFLQKKPEKYTGKVTGKEIL